MINIDGDYLEGGGQIARTALALSAITGKEFHISNIRKERKVSGLKAQHVHCVKALEKLCNGTSRLAMIGSEDLFFTPGKLKGQTLSINIGTSGSISLLMQSLLLPCFFAQEKTRLKITGGTAGKWSMPFEFFTNVFVPQIKRYCESISIKMERRGYYPKGNGLVDIKISPLIDKSNVPKFNALEQGHLIQIKGISHASKDLQKAEVAERQAKAAKMELSRYEVPINIAVEYSDTLSTGSGITLFALFSKDKNELDTLSPVIIGADVLGEKGIKSEDIGKQAVDKLIKEIESKAPVDKHTADNLIPFLALFGGQIKVSKITKHTKTNIWVCEQFLDKKFEIDEVNNIIKVA